MLIGFLCVLYGFYRFAMGFDRVLPCEITGLAMAMDDAVLGSVGASYLYTVRFNFKKGVCSVQSLIISYLPI